MKKQLLFAFACVCGIVSVSAQTEEFVVNVCADTEIPGVTNGVSGNGKYAVGDDGRILTNAAFMWTRESNRFVDIQGVDPTGMETNPDASLYDVSDDGVAVGAFYDGEHPLSDGQVPIRPGYYKDGKWTALPGLDGVELFPDNLNGSAMAISDDGRIIAGQVPVMMGRTVPVLWIDGKIQRIDDLTYEGAGVWIEDMSNDGKILCGFAEWEDGSRGPAIWKDGKMIRVIGTESATSNPEKWEGFYNGRFMSISPDCKTAGGVFEDGLGGAYGFSWTLPEVFDQENAGEVVEMEQLVSVVLNNNCMYTTPNAYGPASYYADGTYTPLLEYLGTTSDYIPSMISGVSNDGRVFSGTFVYTTAMGAVNSPMVISLESADGINTGLMDELNVHLQGTQLCVSGAYDSLSVYGVNGACVLSDNSGATTIDLISLEKGIYVVKVLLNGENRSFKIVR